MKNSRDMARIEVEVIPAWEIDEVVVQVWVDGNIRESVQIPREEIDDVIASMRDAESQMEMMDEQYIQDMEECNPPTPGESLPF